MKRYELKVRETVLQPREKEGITCNKTRGLHKAFNNGGIPLLKPLVKSFKSPQIKICVNVKNTIIKKHIKHKDKPMNTIPYLGQAHETCVRVKLVWWVHNPLPTSGQRKKLKKPTREYLNYN